jgi:L-gulono-1,4-lactone dehydrogenase
MAENARDSGTEQTLVNFGGNVTWTARWYQPRSEQEVLDILERHKHDRVRAIGSLHSWSPVAGGSTVTLDMTHFDAVDLVTRGAETFVRVGAGCRLHSLLDRLHATSERTLPTLGVITQQSISGLTSTGTHGSGKPGVSHFITAVRVAAYDAAGKPTIIEYRDGDELRAARCALGRLGVILSIELPTVPKYNVEETVRRLDQVSDALALYANYPLTQFAVVPHSKTLIVWQRREAPAGSKAGGIRVMIFRAFNFVGMDVFFHLMVKGSLLAGGAVVKMLMKTLPYLLIPNLPRVDASEHALTMKHHLFQHEEMELFVPESKVTEAFELLKNAITMFGGTWATLPGSLERGLHAAGLHQELVQKRGSYVHHYPILFRRVLPEDTLISMASTSSEPWFSISLFTYYAPDRRQDYYALCSWLARAMHALFGARLHWGKHYPLGKAETARMYPRLDTFRSLSQTVDPHGVFRNEFTEKVIG